MRVIGCDGGEQLASSTDLERDARFRTMGEENTLTSSTGADALEHGPEIQLAAYFANPGYQKYGRFLFAVLSAIPWIGSIMGAAAALHAEEEQGRVNFLMR